MVHLVWSFSPTHSVPARIKRFSLFLHCNRQKWGFITDQPKVSTFYFCTACAMPKAVWICISGCLLYKRYFLPFSSGEFIPHVGICFPFLWVICPFIILDNFVFFHFKNKIWLGEIYFRFLVIFAQWVILPIFGSFICLPPFVHIQSN